MTDRIPVKHPIGVDGWVTLDGRTLRAEFPEAPSVSREFDLADIDLVRLVGMLLDQHDAEQTAARRRNERKSGFDG